MRAIARLLSNGRALRALIDEFAHRYFGLRPTALAGLNGRGFIIGSVLACELNACLVPIRNKGKLSYSTMEETYELEYGSTKAEMRTDATNAGDAVVERLFPDAEVAKDAAEQIVGCGLTGYFA